MYRQALRSRHFEAANPACIHLKPRSDNYYECAARAVPLVASADVAAAGTCRMGPAAEPDSVVDPELRVIGVANLRVADASIMPEITSGGVTASAVMIGEKAADMIKKKYGLSRVLQAYGN